MRVVDKVKGWIDRGVCGLKSVAVENLLKPLSYVPTKVSSLLLRPSIEPGL